MASSLINCSKKLKCLEAPVEVEKELLERMIGLILIERTTNNHRNKAMIKHEVRMFKNFIVVSLTLLFSNLALAEAYTCACSSYGAGICCYCIGQTSGAGGSGCAILVNGSQENEIQNLIEGQLIDQGQNLEESNFEKQLTAKIKGASKLKSVIKTSNK